MFKHSMHFSKGLFIVCMVMVQVALGNVQHEVIDWEEQRERFELTENEHQEPAVILKLVQVHEYLYRDPSFSELELYSTVHKIIRVNNDDAIQAHNKIYIPMDDVLELVEIKARSINKNGEVFELDKNNIKEINDDESNGGYKIFAMEGVEIDSEIEYLYTRKMNASYFGRDYYQYSTPVKDAEFQLISPANLIFSCKGYNGFPVLQDTIIDKKRFITAKTDRIQPIKEEEFSFYNANRMRVDYKLSYNTSQGDSRLFTWSDAAARIYSNIYEIDKEELKEVEGFVKSLKLNQHKSIEEKIIHIENHIKSTFSLQKGYTIDYVNLVSVINNKYASERGLVRLFSAIFKNAEIKHELVLTSDRSNTIFDREFDSWNYLVNYLLYIPEEDKYLSPDRLEYRYGMVPYNYTHNYGLFVGSVTIGDFESGVGEVRFISPLSYDQTFDNLKIDIAFNETMDAVDLNIVREMGGYSAVFIQPFYSYLPNDKRIEVIENYIKLSASDAQFTDLKIENGESNLSPLKSPFIIKSKLRSSALIEKAGPKYLLKLGDVIGPQVEMYQEGERKNPIQNDFNRLYDRTIKFTIPNGYQVKNLDDIKMEVHHIKNEDKVFLFQSDYTVDGNLVTVQIDEWYKEIDCEIEYFEEFRKVINAAADFNKVTLVIEKI